MLKIEHLEVGYGESMILRDVNMKVKPGEVICVMGRNGVGKTTLMKSIMGLLKPARGEIHWNDHDLTSLPSDRRAKAGIGYVPQGREIFSQMTVEENLLLGLEAASGRIKTIPESIFAMFPILQEMLHRRGGDLSGGQQQQLAIARALAAEPSLLLLDEPMEGIQPNIVMQIEQIIENIKRSKQMSIFLVEQSLEFATRIADHYVVIDRGIVVAEGNSSELSEEQVKRHLMV